MEAPKTTPEAPEAAAEAPAGESSELTPEQLEHAALAEATVRHPFGPGFFLTQLRAFACQDCPDPAVGLPVVEIHLVDCDVLDLCHIIGVTPSWVALAVNETESAAGKPRIRTEFVPYETIARVTIRAMRELAPHLGFEHGRVPRVLSAQPRPEMTPEAAIRAAAAGTPEPSGD
ncbi:MAG: hypothetical protein AAB113_09235 [Candidatus Eisenbacteria bacterium]